MRKFTTKIESRIFEFKNLKKHSYIFLIAVSSLLLRAYLPGDGGLNAPNDDLLGVRLAHSLIQGHWLGSWNVNTLAKPPLFSFYIAAIHFIPISYKLINHALFLVVSIFLTHYVTKLFQFEKYLHVARAISFSILAFNPFIYQIEFNRVYRQSLVINLIVAYFACCMMILVSIEEMKRDTFKTLRTKKIIIGFAILGLLCGLLELANATSYWILPFSFASLFWQLIRIKSERKNKIKLSVYVLLAGIILYAIPTGIVKGINQYVYGSYRSENFYSGGFSKAINTWASVKNGSDSRPFIAVSRGQRQAVYKISPLAKSLEPFLENPRGTGWKSASCNAPIKVCDESANWFSWQLRDAAMASQNFLNEENFQTFFDNLALEISRGCERRTILCGDPGAGPGSKALSELNYSSIWSYFKLNLFYFLNFEDGGAISTPDQYGSSAEIVKEWHQVVNYRPLKDGVLTSGPPSNKYFKIYQEIFKVFSYLLLLLIMVVFVTSLLRKKSYGMLNLILILGGSGICAALGLSIFDISMGWHLGGMYDLPVVFCFILLSISAINFFLKYSEDFSLSKVEKFIVD